MAASLTRPDRLHLVLLWLAGNALRLTVLAVPPVLTQIHGALHLDETEVGALTALPVLLLSLGAVFGSLLVARLGPRRALLAGLTVVAVAGAARGAVLSTWFLFLMTVLMGAGIAVSQPALPSLVRLWLPGRIGLGTAVYANGQLFGEILAAGLTVSVVLKIVGGDWRAGLAVWSALVLVIVALIAAATSHVPRAAQLPPARWWPNWQDGRTWRLGLILGGASLAYFGANAFLPDFLRATHHRALISPALISINVCQFPASVIAGLLADRLLGRRWPVVCGGTAVLLSAAGFLLGGRWVVVFAGILGFSTALTLVLLLALPALLVDADDVHRLTAAMFTISYACAFVGSLAGGAIWDLTRTPVAAFSPVAVAGGMMALLVLGLHAPQARALDIQG